MWTIAKNADPAVTFDSLGLSGLNRTLTNQAPDTFTFVAPAADPLAVPAFVYGDKITVYRSGDKYFEGKIVTNPRHGSDGSEGVAYAALGPWKSLEENPFQYSWKIRNAGTGLLENKYFSHLLLYLDETGGVLTGGQQIKKVIDYISSVEFGTPMQLAADFLTVFPVLNLLPDEVREFTCADVIKRTLRWTPDAVTYFDYSTTPPTLHIRRKSGATAATVATTGLAEASVNLTSGQASFQITPRPDLQRPAVILYFQSTSEVDGEIYKDRVVQKYPLAAAEKTDRALISTIDLQGFKGAHAFSSPECAAIAHADPSWWRARSPDLSDPAVEIVRVTPISALYDDDSTPWVSEDYPRQLIQGQVAPWMNKEAHDITIKVLLHIKYHNGTIADPVLQEFEVVAAVKITATDAVTQDYSSLVVHESPEPIPSDLARRVYESIIDLQFEGRVNIIEEQVGGQITVGKVLNLTNGAGEWATMKALIQTVNESLGDGVTTITFGPPTRLGPDGLLELLRQGRNRRVTTSPSSISTGKSGADGKVTLGSQVAKENTTGGPQRYSKSGVGSSVGANASNYRIEQEAKPEEVKFILKDVTEGSGTSKHISLDLIRKLAELDFTTPAKKSFARLIWNDDNKEVLIQEGDTKLLLDAKNKVIKIYDEVADKSISMNLELLPNGKHIQPREEPFCQNGVERKIYGMFSEVFG